MICKRIQFLNSDDMQKNSMFKYEIDYAPKIA